MFLKHASGFALLAGARREGNAQAASATEKKELGLQQYSFARPAMGSVFRIELFAGNAGHAAAAADAAFAEVERLNQIASDYLPESELSRLNLAPANQPVKLSEDLFALIAASMWCAEQTEGAFDITAAYAVQHWRRARRQKKLPTPEQRAFALEKTDWRQIKMDASDRTITKQRDGIKLDLGGIGKGYAADKALHILLEQGMDRALVAGSGDLAIGAPPPGKAGWDVALRTFERPEAADVMMHLTLANCGCSTSGDLHQHFELDGTRYSHIIDPRTGLGLTARIACTVVAPTSAVCDALATAFCVTGVRKGLELAGKMNGVQARFSTMSGTRIDYTETAGFETLRHKI